MRFIQIRYIQFCVKIGQFCVIWTRGTNCSTSITTLNERKKNSKYLHNTNNYFPPEPKKLTQHHNCMVLKVHSSMYNQNLFSARTKN